MPNVSCVLLFKELARNARQSISNDGGFQEIARGNVFPPTVTIFYLQGAAPPAPLSAASAADTRLPPLRGNPATPPEFTLSHKTPFEALGVQFMNTSVSLRFWSILCGIGAALFLAIALPVSAQAQTWEKVYDGVQYTTLNDGGKIVYAVRLETRLMGVSIFPYVSASKAEAATPQAWAQTHGLQVAVNANFFNMTTLDAIGIVASNGKIWGSADNANYAQIGFTQDNRPKSIPMATIATATSHPWMYNVVSGTPEIIKDGAVISGLHTSAACVGLGHCTHYRSRTGIGLSKNGEYLILAVVMDGTQGMTINQFAAQMVRLGVDYGVNLDGGGSTGLYVGNKPYRGNTARRCPVNIGFKVGAAPDYICKLAQVDNPGGFFKDIPVGHWGLAAAEALRTRGITSGCQGGATPLFCPDCGTKRIQAAIFLGRALGLATLTPAVPSFADVTVASVGVEGFGYVEALLVKGIISPASQFRPNDVITRVEVATLMAKAYIANYEAFAQAPTPSFSDVPKTHWGYMFVEALARACHVVGSDGRFRPADPMTRIEFAALLSRVAGYLSPGTCAFVKQCSTIGQTSCDGQNLRTCVAYEWQTTSCPSGTQCADGVCRTQAVCTGSATQCEGNYLKTCQNGAYVLQACPHGLCDKGACVACLASAPTCSGDTVVACRDGMIVATACGSQERCAGGVCQPVEGTCSEGSLRCSGSEVHACSGGRWHLIQDCALSGAMCHGGACESQDCNDAAPPACDGNRIRTCRSGSWQFVDCGHGETCRDATCVLPETCNASTLPQCDGDAVRSCQDGKWHYAHCEEDQLCMGAACVEAAACSGTEAAYCEGAATVLACQDGKWKAVLCESGRVCLDGVCVLLSCDAASVPQCQGSTAVRLCQDGRWVFEHCREGQACVDGQCAAVAGCDPATPGVCDGQAIRYCDAGTWKTQVCPPGHACQHGACIRNGDGNEHGVGSIDSGCSKGQTGARGGLLALAVLLGLFLCLRRRHEHVR